MNEENVKIRYSKKEFQKIKDESKKLNKTPNEYQKEISKKAKVKIEYED